MPIYTMTLDPVTNVHPARIAAANGGKNPYCLSMNTFTALTHNLRHAWRNHAEGGAHAAKYLREANELTRIQLATR